MAKHAPTIDLAPLQGFAARYRTWSKEEEAAAQAMRVAGNTLAAIGEALDRSLTSVQSCLCRLENRRNLKLRPKNPATRPCMCCQKPFVSEGSHNRLCGDCRNKNISPYAL